MPVPTTATAPIAASWPTDPADWRHDEPPPQNRWEPDPPRTSTNGTPPARDDGFAVEIVELTPQLAEQLLARTDHNPRRLRRETVETYARDIELGEWPIGGGFLALDRCGCLVQGQHTCWAVIEAGEPVEMVLFRNVSPAAVRAMDTGRKRTVGQILQMEGVQNAAQVGTTVRYLWLWQRGNFARRSAGDTSGSPTIPETLQMLRDHPGIVESVKAVNAVVSSPIWMRVSVAGPLHWVGTQIAPTAVDPFFDRLRSGADMTATDPVLHLRNWLQVAHDKQERGQRLRSQTMLHVAVKAWNAYIEGRPMKQLRVTSRDRFPEMLGHNGAVWPQLDADVS